MKKDDIRLLRIKAQDLGIKYVSKYNKAQLKGMIAKRDPEFMMKAIFGDDEPANIYTVKIPKGTKNIKLNIEII